MLILAGALSLGVGLVLGLLGGGGSILMLPLLVYVVGMEPRAAIATSLLVVAVTSATGLVPHARAGRTRWATGLVFGMAGMAGAYGAGRASGLFPARALLLGFAALMAVTAVAMLRRKPAAAGATPPEPRGPLSIGGIGLVVGSITGLVGAGGGFVIVPALCLLGGLAMPEAVGTSLLVIAMQSTAAFVGHAAHATVDLPVAAALSAAAAVGSLVGARLSGRVRPDQLRKGFAWFVLAVALLMVTRELAGG